MAGALPPRARARSVPGVVANGSGDLGDVKLSEKLHVHKSTVHRLLAVLYPNGFVERKPSGAKYCVNWVAFGGQDSIRLSGGK